MPNNIYQKIILNSLNKLLNLLDKNFASISYGCFDKNYWQYKTVTDFPSSIYQQGVLSLTLYYLNNFENNFLFNNSQTLEFIFAALKFWQKIQNKNGSFNEWYAGENSQVATAFTSYAVSETLILLDKEVPHSLKFSLIESLQKANNFLIKNNDYLVANHEAGTLISLLNFYLLTKNENQKNIYEKKLNYFLKLQNKEGWFAEYGGADGGYLSLTLDFLAKIYLKTNNKKILTILKNGYNFLLNLFYPDNTFNLELGSRNTSYLFPAGIEIASSLHINSAEILKQKFYSSLEKNKMLNPQTVDDRYFIFFFLPNYLQADIVQKAEKSNYELRIKNYELKEEQETKNLKLNNQNNENTSSKTFNSAGLIIYKNNFYNFFANYKKGFIFKIFYLNKLINCDNGYFLKTSKNYYATCWLDISKKLKFNFLNNKIIYEITTPFVVYKNFPVDNKLLFFKIFFKYFGRTSFSFLVQKLIRKYFIIRHKKSSNILKRKIILTENKIEILDKVFLSIKQTVKNLSLQNNGNIIYSPTANNFLNLPLIKAKELENLKIYIKNNKLSLKRSFVFKEDKVIFNLSINDKLVVEKKYENFIFSST